MLEAASLGLSYAAGLEVSTPLDSTPSALAAAAIREQILAPRKTRASLPAWDECVDKLETVYRECVA